MKRSEEFNPPLSKHDLVMTALMLLFCMYAFFMTSCISFKKPSGEEPEWKPDLLYAKSVEGRCTFKSPTSGLKVDCDEPNIYDYILIDSESFILLKKKMDACEAWE